MVSVEKGTGNAVSLNYTHQDPRKIFLLPNKLLETVIYQYESKDMYHKRQRSKEDFKICLEEVCGITDILMSSKQYKNCSFKLTLNDKEATEYTFSAESRQAMEEWVNGLREAKEFWMQHHKRQEFKQKINNQGTFANESISLHNADKCLDDSISSDSSECCEPVQVSVTTWDTITHKILLPCVFNVEELLSALHEKSQTIRCAACHICKLQQSSMEVWTVTANGIGHKLDIEDGTLDVSKHGKHFYLLVHNYKLLIIHFEDGTFQVIPCLVSIKAKEVPFLPIFADKLASLGINNFGLFLVNENGTSFPFDPEEEPLKYSFQGRLILKSKAMTVSSAVTPRGSDIQRRRLRKKQQNRREMKALKVVEKEKCKHTSNLHESRTDKNGCSPPDGLVFYDQHYGMSDDVNNLGASASADRVNSSIESETDGENGSNEPRESVETSGISQEEENDSGDEDFVPDEETDNVLCEEGDGEITEQPAANATKGSDERECSTQESGENFDNCCAKLNSSSLAMPEHALHGQTEGELSNSSVENGQSPGKTDERIKSRIKNSSRDEPFFNGSESRETRSTVGPVSTDDEMVSAAWTCNNKDTSVKANSGSEQMDHNDKTLLFGNEKTIKHVNIEYGSNENHPNGITKEDLVQNESSENTCETRVLGVAGGDNNSPSDPDGTPCAAEPVGTAIHSVETTDIQDGFPGCPALADKGTDSHCASCVCDEQCDYTIVSSPRVLELVLKICSGHKVNEEEVGEANKFSRICLSGWHLQCENGSWFVVEQRARQVDNHTLSSAVKVHLSDRLEAFFNNEDKLWTVVENEHVHDERTVLTSEIQDQDLKDTFTVTENSSADQEDTPEERVVTPILSQSNSSEDLNVKLLDSKVNDDGTENATKVKGPKPVGVYADVARSRTESSSHEALHAAIQGIFLHIFELGELPEEALDYSRHKGLVDSVCSPLCSALRNILSTGLRKKIIGKYTLWSIVEELKDVSGDINMTVNWVNNRYACLSDAQKFQVFVYECLNIGRGTLHHWLEKFIRQNKTRSNGKQGNKFYNHDGIVFQLSREKLEEMVLDLSRISDLPFKINVESWINNHGVGLHETAFTFE